MVSYTKGDRFDTIISVLILIVVDDGLVLAAISVGKNGDVSLNPYCSGRWSRTGTSPSFDGSCSWS